MRSAFAAWLFICVAVVSLAEVADSGASGFTVKISTNISAPPTDVYSKLVHDIGNWWNSEHTFSKNAHNLSIDERVGGCFCEKLVDGAVRQMEVGYLRTGKTIRLLGGLGPLQEVGASGALTFNLTPEKSGTKLDVTYVVTGYSAQGMNDWAAPVDGVLSEQIARFKTYVETGSAPGPEIPEQKPK